MPPGLLESIYNGAASIAKPLSMAALLATFLTITIRQVVKSLKKPLESATSQDAVKIVLSSLKYLFILSLIALAGGILSYILEFFLQDYVKKYSMVDSARAAISIQDPRGIMKYANILINEYPEYAEGYHYSGIGNFYAKNYSAAAIDFAKALKYLSTSSDECDDKRRDFVFNLAAAQAAAGDNAGSLSFMKSMDKCWSEKPELFNYGKILLMNGMFSEAEEKLSAAKLTDNGRPDYVSRVWMERGILHIAQKNKNWINEAIDCFRKAVHHNNDFIKIIICGETSDKIEPPGMVEDFDYEISILNDISNAEHVKIIRAGLRGSELCGA